MHVMISMVCDTIDDYKYIKVQAVKVFCAFESWPEIAKVPLGFFSFCKMKSIIRINIKTYDMVTSSILSCFFQKLLIKCSFI